MKKSAPVVPPPWQTMESGNSNLIHIETSPDGPPPHGEPVCSMPAKMRNTAERIVACVNACEGIADPSALKDVLDFVRSVAESEAPAVTRPSASADEWWARAIWMARAAIAKAEGKP